MIDIKQESNMMDNMINNNSNGSDLEDINSYQEAREEAIILELNNKLADYNELVSRLEDNELEKTDYLKSQKELISQLTNHLKDYQSSSRHLSLLIENQNKQIEKLIISENAYKLRLDEKKRTIDKLEKKLDSDDKRPFKEKDTKNLSNEINFSSI